MTESQWVAVARVLKPHGVRGGLKLEVLTDNPNRLQKGKTVWLDREKRTITSVKPLNRACVITLAGVETPEQGELFRNQYLEVPEDELACLPDGEFYIHDLVDMQVFDNHGGALGYVSRVYQQAGQDILGVMLAKTGKEFLFPMTADVIRKVDVTQKAIMVDTRMFDDFLE